MVDFLERDPSTRGTHSTPAGIGSARTPPVYLKPGDRIECAVEGIGRQNNPIAQGLP